MSLLTSLSICAVLSVYADGKFETNITHISSSNDIGLISQPDLISLLSKGTAAITKVGWTNDIRIPQENSRNGESVGSSLLTTRALTPRELGVSYSHSAATASAVSEESSVTTSVVQEGSFTNDSTAGSTKDDADTKDLFLLLSTTGPMNALRESSSPSTEYKLTNPSTGETAKDEKAHDINSEKEMTNSLHTSETVLLDPAWVDEDVRSLRKQTTHYGSTLQKTDLQHNLSSTPSSWSDGGFEESPNSESQISEDASRINDSNSHMITGELKTINSENNSRWDYEKTYHLLQQFIFSHPTIIRRMPPYEVVYPTSSTGLTVKFIPFKILTVDEVVQSVSISCYIQLKWQDSSLTWDPATYNNISQFVINSSELWTPKIVLPTSNGQGLFLDTPDFVTIFGTRANNMIMKYPFQFTVLCNLDLSKFPFDYQTCEILFTELNGIAIFHSESKERDFQLVESLHTSGEWEIVQWYYNGDGEELQSLRYIIEMRRHSTFYVANILAPLYLTSAMTLLVFWIPADSGEKMSCLVSMFVSTSVFEYMINSEMPRSIKKLPVINVVIISVISEIILASMATLLVLNRYGHEQSRRNRAYRNAESFSESGQNTNTLLNRYNASSFFSSIDSGEGGVKKPGFCESGNQKMANVTGYIKNKIVSYICEKSKCLFTNPPLSNDYDEQEEVPVEKEEKNNAQKEKRHTKLGDMEDRGQTFAEMTSAWPSHRVLDMVFFVLFLLANILGAIFTFLAWS